MKAYPCEIFRGGTSKGLFFLASDLPQDAKARDRILLAAMGSPDPRQIDGLGGAHPLTSKVALVAPSTRPDADVDYTFFQLGVERALVSSEQDCGNLLSAVAPFALENKLLPANDGSTLVRVYMVNSGAFANVTVETPARKVNYLGNSRIDGVPGTAAAINIEFLNTLGSSCGALFPTGNLIDTIENTQVTCIDNGMPLVLLRAEDFFINGEEPPLILEGNAQLKARVEAIRLIAGEKMSLGNVENKTIPKMMLLTQGKQHCQINTRTFIPHRVHEAIGVLASVSVASACLIPGTIAHQLSHKRITRGQALNVGHPTGYFSLDIEVEKDYVAGGYTVKRAALLRTARRLMRGEVFVAEKPETCEQGS